MTTSPSGANTFIVRGFKNQQKLMNHWQNGRTHRDEYPNFTIGQYVQRALELLEQPVSENILGHADKYGHVICYDKMTNDFAKGQLYLI